jgi:cytochrome c oxidase assembly protein subunit 15
MLKRTQEYKPYLGYFAWFGLIWVVCLLYAGGFTTSIKAGMAFLDWPLSNGSLNPEGWTTQSDQLAEHSHRLLGMKIGLITMMLAGWSFLREGRRWVRMLSLALFLSVVFQGVLGGLRVKLDQLNIMSEHNGLAQMFAVMHACGAQIILCLFVTLAVVLSRFWYQSRRLQMAPVAPKLIRLGFVVITATFVQLLMGAVMRHWDAGLAIPTFPLTPENTLMPTHWSFQVAIHFAHRVGAVVVAVLTLIYVWQIWQIQESNPRWKMFTGILICLLSVQIFLGALVIWSVKNPYAATIHMLMGAFFLAANWTLVLQLMRTAYFNPCSIITQEHLKVISNP